nr:hypothetical protein Iba_chr10aCG4740 [Ipomoea batatas]GME08742.1 hypothetical protein Iba_scaffold8000.4CG0190 [Ipomoea batatas]
MLGKGTFVFAFYHRHYCFSLGKGKHKELEIFHCDAALSGRIVWLGWDIIGLYLFIWGKNIELKSLIKEEGEAEAAEAVARDGDASGKSYDNNGSEIMLEAFTKKMMHISRYFGMGMIGMWNPRLQ